MPINGIKLVSVQVLICEGEINIFSKKSWGGRVGVGESEAHGVFMNCFSVTFCGYPIGSNIYIYIYYLGAT